MNINKFFTTLFGIGILLVLLGLYKYYNPISSMYFPRCPFRVLTGLQCSGCGSQRAIHHLLNFELLKASKENLLLVIATPYLATGLFFEYLSKPNETYLKWRKILFGRKAIFIILLTIVSFGVIRNLF